MTPESIIYQCSIASHLGLSKIYEGICNVYRDRLLEGFGFDVADSFWVADIVGGVLCINDIEYSIGMNDIRILVDNAVNFDDFREWWNCNMTTQDINAYSWFILGYRPTKE